VRARSIRALDGYIFMSESIRKFREGWRSYLLWGLLYALFIAPVIGIVLFSREGEENKRYVPELRKIAEQTNVYPGFQKSGEKVVLKHNMVYFFTYYKSDAQFSDVKKFYDSVLAEQGWGPHEQPSPSIFVGEAHVVSYRRGDYVIDVEETKEGYSIVFLWQPE
jgi:hypothetical protein